MDHKHDEHIPAGIEAVVTRLSDLERVIGPQAAPVVDAVRAKLLSAMAARDRGDLPGAYRQIGEAMDQLTTLADQLDAAEGALMRALALHFRTALLRGDHAGAHEAAAVMFEKSGAVERKKS